MLKCLATMRIKKYMRLIKVCAHVCRNYFPVPIKGTEPNKDLGKKTFT